MSTRWQWALTVAIFVGITAHAVVTQRWGELAYPAINFALYAWAWWYLRRHPEAWR